MGVLRHGSQDEAIEIKYNNANTNLPASNVQEALDSISLRMAQLSNLISTDDDDLSGTVSSGPYVNKTDIFGGDVNGTFNAIEIVDDSHNHSKSISDFTVQGNLSVLGTSCNIKSLKTYIDSSSLLMNAFETGASSKNISFEVERGTLNNVSILWDETYDSWKLTTDGSQFHTIWHEGNDGSNSKLDSDLLDGQHGSYYLDFTNSNNKPEPFLSNNYSFPSMDGRLIVEEKQINQVLETDGKGQLYWADKVSTGWKFIDSEIIVRGTKASLNPVWEKMGTTAFYAYNFSVNTECQLKFKIPRDYKPGGDVFVHLDWTTSGVSTGVIRFKLEYTITKGHNAAIGGTLFQPTYTSYIEHSGSGVAWRRMTSETETSLNLTNIEPDSIILIKLTRLTYSSTTTTTLLSGNYGSGNNGQTGTGTNSGENNNGKGPNSNTSGYGVSYGWSTNLTNNIDSVYVLGMSLAYETDRTSTVNRRPNFYGGNL